MLATRCTILAALATTTLPAQTTAAAVAAPPHVVVETFGPDGWRVRLAPTNLGSMLSSERGRALWQPLVEPGFDACKRVLGADAYEAARERLLGYGGRVRIGVRFAVEKDGPDGPTAMVLVADGDGRTDLTKMAADLRLVLTRTLPEPWAPLDLGGEQFETRRDGEQLVTAPRIEGEHLVMCTGSPETIAECRAMLPLLLQRPAVAITSPALRVEFDVAALVRPRLLDGEDGRVFRALGFGSLGHLEATLTTAGPRVTIETAQHFTLMERGVFAALMPNRQELSPTIALASASKTTWKVGRFDWNALYDAISEAMVTSGDAEDDDEVRREILKSTGVDLRDQLLAKMSDELVVVGSPLHELRGIQDVGWALGVRLLDADGFEQTLLTLLANAKPWLSREATVDADGVSLHRYGNMVDYDLWFAVGHGMAFLAAGRDAEQQLGDLLAAAKAMPKQAPAAARLQGFQDLARHLPDGLHGLARGDIDEVLALPADFWLDILEEVLPFSRGGFPTTSADEQREHTRAMLKEHDLLTVRTTTAFADNIWRWRLFW
jgi:hypothetical protein